MSCTNWKQTNRRQHGPSTLDSCTEKWKEDVKEMEDHFTISSQVAGQLMQNVCSGLKVSSIKG